MEGTEYFSIVSVVGGLIIYQLVFVGLRAWARKKKRALPTLLNRYIYYPGMFLMFVIAASVGLLFLKDLIGPYTLRILEHLVRILIIIGSGFLLIRILTVFRELTVYHYQDEETDDIFRYRRVSTRFTLIQRVLNFIIGILTIGAVLMTFESVRQVGSTILASAGVVGLIVGFAAQKSLGSLFAGIQIAVSQPVRIGDVVVVDEYFGTITEITLTYAVLDTYDGRRLVIPINFFLENTFENWTRISADVVAKIYIRTDYSVPVDELRKVFLEWLETSDLWDKRKARFLVTKAEEKTLELRGTATTRNSDDAFDLECEMREKLVHYVQQNYPDALPKTRMVVSDQEQSEAPNRTDQPPTGD